MFEDCPAGPEVGAWSLALERERSSIFLIYHAAIDDPILELEIVGYLHVGRWLVDISPADHIFMDKKQEREWYAILFDVKGDRDGPALPWNWSNYGYAL